MIRIVHRENTAAMADLCVAGERFTLAYCDPPFFTQRSYRTTRGELAFTDRWAHLGEYLEHLVAAAVCAWSLLTPEGSLVVHVDTRVSHHLKVALDGALGRHLFASEIVWRYRRWPSKTQNFQRMHDVLLRYRRDVLTPPRFTQLYEPAAPSTLVTWGTTKQRAVVDAEGRRTRSSSTDEASPGVPLGDVWDIGIVAPSSRERTGYPTQKPEALLERLVGSLTAPGDSVIDPFMGSGTALVVCARMGRHALGIDQSDVAVRVATERLAMIGGAPRFAV